MVSKLAFFLTDDQPYLTMNTPITVSTWHSVLRSIPVDRRRNLNLEALLASDEPATFLSISSGCQKALLDFIFPGEEQLAEEIFACLSAYQVLQPHSLNVFSIFLTSFPFALAPPNFAGQN